MRSYVVKRLPHFKHSRLRRIDSASLLSRESTTLSFANPQKGHFMALMLIENESARLNQMFGVNTEIVTGGIRPRRTDRTYVIDRGELCVLRAKFLDEQAQSRENAEPACDIHADLDENPVTGAPALRTPNEEARYVRSRGRKRVVVRYGVRSHSKQQ